MADSIRFRGPDGAGAWCDENISLALAHRRLAILDLSEAGHQPMISPSGRYVIVFNGEVYNADRFRPDLEKKGYTFRGHSDTEIMLALIEEHGLNDAVQHFIGMFAFALWDGRDHKLHLVRDRVGVKPLYYGIVDGTLFFGSQLKSFYSHPSWHQNGRSSNSIDFQVLSEYLTYNYIPGDKCIYKDFSKVTPGTIVTFTQSSDGTFKEVKTSYYDMISTYHHAKARLFTSDQDAMSQLHDLLKDAVKLRMISDVPLGAFLSGGIDSSLVVALMQEASGSTPVKTFTIGFKEDRFNEAQYAEAVGKHLKTEHHTFYLSAKDALDIIPNLSTFYDEPFADSSQIPTYLVSKMARQHVTVALSGDGGDEFFAGYTRHHMCEKLWGALSHLPLSLRRSLSPFVRHMANPRYEKFFQSFLRMSNIPDKLMKLSDLLTSNTIKDIFHGTYALWKTEDIEKMTGEKPEAFDTLWQRLDSAKTSLEQMQLCDGLMYLEGDILTKVDRASMAHSLEAREPLLDHRLIEHAFAMPPHLKLHKEQGKIALRQILDRYVPRELIDRPKQGFGVPIGEWLRGPLKEWAFDLLTPSKLKDNGILDATPLAKKLNEHVNGTHDRAYALWGILMYQAWCEDQKKSAMKKV